MPQTVENAKLERSLNQLLNKFDMKVRSNDIETLPKIQS